MKHNGFDGYQQEGKAGAEIVWLKKIPGSTPGGEAQRRTFPTSTDLSSLARYLRTHPIVPTLAVYVCLSLNSKLSVYLPLACIMLPIRVARPIALRMIPKRTSSVLRARYSTEQYEFIKTSTPKDGVGLGMFLHFML